jgi:hypothetical protein
MIDWLTEKQKSDAKRKADEAAAIAAFVAEGKVKNLGYSDKKYMDRIQRNWNRSISPTEIAKKEEEDKFCIFSKDERR